MDAYVDHKLEIGADFQEKVVKPFILKSRQTIDILTWSISNFLVDVSPRQRIAELLKQRVRKYGVKVRIIFGNKKNTDLVRNEFQSPGIEARCMEHNHSKIVLVDDKLAYVGSGNFTARGIGSKWGKHLNLEVSVLFWEPMDVMKLKDFFNLVWKYSDPI